MSLTKEADAINGYEPRIAVEADEEAKQVMAQAQKREGSLVDLAEKSEEVVSDE